MIKNCASIMQDATNCLIHTNLFLFTFEMQKLVINYAFHWFLSYRKSIGGCVCKFSSEFLYGRFHSSQICAIVYNTS